MTTTDVTLASSFPRFRRRPNPAPVPGWSNWSGSATGNPAHMLRPRSETALSQAIANSRGQLRVRGTGHSFTKLCATDDTLISLEEMSGDLLDHRKTGSEDIVRVHAGASLNTLSRALEARGLGFKNLGDIDVQSVAGAAMTATHGTGKMFPCLSGEIRRARLVTANGDVIEADAESDLVDAARVSLGALGVLSEIDMSVRSAFKLHRVAEVRKRSDLMSEAHTIWDTNRNFEFFVLPFCDYGLSIIHNETTEADMHEGEGDDEVALAQLRFVRNATKRMPRMRRRLLNTFIRTTKTETRIGTSYKLLASVRNTRFHEMEYHMPVDNGLEALAEVVRLIETERPDVFFPIEVRMSAADTGWLSPFEGAPRISVAVHVHQPDDFDWFFTRLEPIFRRHLGRPHWGKLHSLKARDLAEMYPRFGDFQKLRSELDPKGRFINAHLGRLFDVTVG